MPVETGIQRGRGLPLATRAQISYMSQDCFVANAPGHDEPLVLGKLLGVIENPLQRLEAFEE